jgi:hypothetical protein
LLVEALFLFAAATGLKAGRLGGGSGHVQEVDHRGPLSREFEAVVAAVS